MKKIIITILCLLLCLASFAACSDSAGLLPTFEKGKIYDQAVSLFEQGELQEAYDLFLTIEDYHDVKEYLERIPVEMESRRIYRDALQLLEQGKLQEARDIFLTIKDYADVSEYLDRFVYRYETYRKTDIEGTNIQYTYDQYGRILKTEEYNRSNYKNYPLTWVYEYNEQGSVSRAIRKLEDGTDLIYLYEYDKKGNITKVTNPTGTTMEFLYDIQGNAIEKIFKDAQGKTQYHATYQYTEYGDVLSVQALDGVLGEEKEYSVTYEYEYDKHGRKTKLSVSSMTEEWEYDEQGHVTQYHKEYANGEFQTYKYKYDSYGNVSEQFRESNTPGMSVPHTAWYEREYDAYGNILSETMDSDGGWVEYSAHYSGYQLYYNPYGVCEIPDWVIGTP